MAIVRMKKITILGLEGNKDQIVDSLMKMGVVEVVNIQPDSLDEKQARLLTKDGDETGVSELEAQIARVKSSIDYVTKYDTRKKGLFEPKRVLNPESYAEIVKGSGRIWRIVEQIGEYDERLSALRSEENRLVNLIGSLEPWQTLKLPLEAASTKSTVILMGVVPSIADTGELVQRLYEAAPEVHIEVIGSDRDQSYLFIICHKAVEEDAGGILKQYGFTRVAFKDLSGTPEDNIIQSGNRIKDIENERSEIEKKIAGLAGEQGSLEVLYDHLVIVRDKKYELSNLIRTNKAFMLQGWVPAESAEKVANAVERLGDCMVEVLEPEKDEEYPILLRNNSFVKPFELITELYSLPSSKGIDPNIFMAPFYFIFFGMMVSDAGYGLLMAIATGVILLKFKPQGMAQKLIGLLFFGGVSTFIWGVLFGGWFGNIVDAVTNGTYTIPPLWFNPLDDPMRLLMWSFIFGGIHIFVGMGLKGYMLVKDGKPLDALFDIGFWYILLIGLVMLAGPGIVGTAGKYMSIGGAVLLVLTQGRNEKSVVKRLVTGILSLYNVTGFLSDVLSYSRLLALGLATGVIATVINTMGTLFGLNVGGIIILIIVFVIGTVFNILINALGAYVHASRLQYVEFFGKFYEGGGKSFQPFKINTKYININKQEAK